MKTIFRYMNVGLLAAVFFAFGAVAGSAQDNCADDEATATARTAAGDKVREDFGVYANKSLDEKGKIINNAKAFVEKYGACAPVKDLVDYLNQYLPGMETALRQAREKAEEDALVQPFDAALKAKNWDEVMNTGKKILAKYPDKYRTVEIVLAAMAGEEGLKNNFKYADDGIRFGKQSIADLEAGKSFLVGKDTRYGLSLKGVYNFGFATKEDAMGWLNLYVAYLTHAGQKNPTGALPYFYKASQAPGSEAAKHSLPFDMIGAYYIGELNKIYDEIAALRAQQDKEGITEDELKQVVAQIKAKVALANGTSERAMDAFARATTLAKDPAIKARTRKTLEELYRRRFDKTEGVDAWVATAINKPFVNPQTPITPISDEPTAATTSSPAEATNTTSEPATTTKPATAPATKPAAKTNGAKPSATVKKTVKRKVA